MYVFIYNLRFELKYTDINKTNIYIYATDNNSNLKCQQ